MNSSGDIYGVGAGRVSRLAMFNNEGYFDRELSAETVGEHLDKIRDLAGAEARRQFRGREFPIYTLGALDRRK